MGLKDAFVNYASRPNVQEKFAKIASSGAKKAINYAKNNPNKVKSLASRGFQLAKNSSQNPNVQRFLFGNRTLKNDSNLEERVSTLEGQMGMIMGMIQRFGVGGKTRKQKRKQRKTRKH